MQIFSIVHYSVYDIVPTRTCACGHVYIAVNSCVCVYCLHKITDDFVPTYLSNKAS